MTRKIGNVNWRQVAQVKDRWRTATWGALTSWSGATQEGGGGGEAEEEEGEEEELESGILNLVQSRP
jgi:hypothetical protein